MAGADCRCRGRQLGGTFDGERSHHAVFYLKCLHLRARPQWVVLDAEAILELGIT